MKPFAYEKRKCEFFTASPRHENGTFADLVNGGSVASNFVRKLSLDEQGDANIGLIGDVRLG